MAIDKRPTKLESGWKWTLRGLGIFLTLVLLMVDRQLLSNLMLLILVLLFGPELARTQIGINDKKKDDEE